MNTLHSVRMLCNVPSQLFEALAYCLRSAIWLPTGKFMLLFVEVKRL
jgi:hypothetical protein